MKTSVYWLSPVREEFRPAPTELAAKCLMNDRARHQKVWNSIEQKGTKKPAKRPRAVEPAL
jgi:hypothetical protein